MEFKGTKGKWSVVEDCEGEIFIECNNPCWTICNTLSNYDNDKANALLISKAHDMLEMLNRVSKKLEGNGFPTLKSEVDKLIKEATEI